MILIHPSSLLWITSVFALLSSPVAPLSVFRSNTKLQTKLSPPQRKPQHQHVQHHPVYSHKISRVRQGMEKTISYRDSSCSGYGCYSFSLFLTSTFDTSSFEKATSYMLSNNDSNSYSTICRRLDRQTTIMASNLRVAEIRGRRIPRRNQSLRLLSLVFNSFANNEKDTNNGSIDNTSHQQLKQKRRRRICVVVLPAQFCVADDYNVLIENLRAYSSSSSIMSNDSNDNMVDIGTCVVCDLPRTEWIKVAKQVPTAEFWNSNLNVQRTLDWYFRSIDSAVSRILELEHSRNKEINEQINLCFIGHSIGGWVGRAYLGGMGCTNTAVQRSAVQQMCTSFISLGTPHIVSPTSIVDQTRGLIKSIELTPTCQPSYLARNKKISLTCICSNGIVVGGSSNGDDETSQMPSFVEQLIALTSYVPLLGIDALFPPKDNDGDVGGKTIKTTRMVGDGIVPLEVAFMINNKSNIPLPEIEGSSSINAYFLSTESNSDSDVQNVILTECSKTKQPIRHSHVLPTPWNLYKPNEPSITIPYPSYVTDGVVGQWFKYIQ